MMNRDKRRLSGDGRDSSPGGSRLVTRQATTHIMLMLVLILVSGCRPEAPGFTDPEHYFPLDGRESWQRIETELADYYLQEVVSGLEIPWGMAFLPDGRLLVTERSGNIRLIRDGRLTEQPLTGVPDVHTARTSGLMDIAIHPEFEENGWIYFTYSSPEADSRHNTAVMRARLDGQRLTDQERVFRGVPLTPIASHSGSRILFQNGYLFFSIGDRGEMELAQELSSHAGTVIRLHDDGTVPKDNPLVGMADARPEIWSYGHRNIQGLAYLPDRDELWAVEHGPVGGDELNRIVPGGNYGWPIVTHGLQNGSPEVSGPAIDEGFLDPVHIWTPALAPSAMMVVDSPYYPEWQDNLIVSGLAGMRLVRLVLDGPRVAHEEDLLIGLGRFRNVITGPDGFIYIASDSDGTIRRLIPEDFR